MSKAIYRALLLWALSMLLSFITITVVSGQGSTNITLVSPTGERVSHVQKKKTQYIKKKPCKASKKRRAADRGFVSKRNKGHISCAKKHRQVKRNSHRLTH